MTETLPQEGREDWAKEKAAELLSGEPIGDPLLLEIAGYLGRIDKHLETLLDRTAPVDRTDEILRRLSNLEGAVASTLEGVRDILEAAVCASEAGEEDEVLLEKILAAVTTTVGEDPSTDTQRRLEARGGDLTEPPKW